MIAPRLGSALRRTTRIATARPGGAVWTLLAVTCALFVVGGGALAADSIDTWTTARTGGGATMVVYLGDGVDLAHANLLATQLSKLPGVEHAELVPAAESAHRLQDALGADAALLDGVELGSLPASVEVALAPGVRDVIAMSPTLHALRGTPGVDDVVVEEAGADKLAGALAAIRVIAWTAAALLAALALLAVVTILRGRFDRDDEERDVLDLLGAHPTFAGVPTALAGGLHGALAALLAAAGLYVAIVQVGDRLARAFATAIGTIAPGTVAIPDVSMIAMFVALGAALGIVGGGLAGAARAAR